MTSPSFVPPPPRGWWVKDNQVVFPAAAALTLTGNAPRITQGKTIAPAAAALTLTGNAPRITIGQTITPTAATLTLTGSTPRLIKTVRPTPALLSLTSSTPRVGAQYVDGFNRADSTTSVGSQWTNRLNTMAINTSGAYAVTSGQYSFATYNPGMIFDDMRVSITAGDVQGANETIVLVLGADTSGQCMTLEANSLFAGFYLKYHTSWGATTDIWSVGGVINTGDVMTLERIGNTYTPSLNGIVGTTFIDSTTVLPRDSSHRLTGIGGFNDTGSYRRIDLFTAENI